MIEKFQVTWHWSPPLKVLIVLFYEHCSLRFIGSLFEFLVKLRCVRATCLGSANKPWGKTCLIYTIFIFLTRCDDRKSLWVLRKTYELWRKGWCQKGQLTEPNVPRPREDCRPGTSSEGSVWSTNSRTIRVCADVWRRNFDHVWGDGLLQSR